MMERKGDLVLLSGNEAIAEGALDAGCNFYAGYPITPQNELIGYLAHRMPAEGRIFIQAESELAAINMVFGASACGMRAMTSSSSPGISLKQEGISYLAGAQLPAVIVNMMRGGPGLGNIAPSQSDYFQATKGGGHGDYHCLVLAPASVQEAYDLMFLAFDLADRYRNPVIVLGDGMLGQMMEPLPKKRHKIKIYPKPWALRGCQGREPNVIKSFYMREGELERFNLFLQRKYARIGKREQRWEDFFVEDARLIVVSYGITSRIAKEVVTSLRKKKFPVGMIRPITLWPFPKQAFASIISKRKFPSLLVVEMSYGQMYEDVCLAVQGRCKVEYLGRAGGGVPQQEEIIRKIKQMLE